MQQIQSVSDSELILMRIIWEHGGVALYAQIASDLTQKNLAWKKSTIVTLLWRLVEKGMLKTNKLGRRNEYSAIVSEQEYSTAQTMQLVDKVYEGDVQGLIATLIHQNIITDVDKAQLIKTWKGSGDSDNNE